MKSSVRIMLVEDSESDIELTRIAFAQSRLDIELSVARDGEEALEHLTHLAEQEDALPALILLDLGLPRADGKHVLAALKEHEKLRTIPVIIYTGSCSCSDIIDAYKSYASCYIIKPKGLEAAKEMTQRVEEYCALGTAERF